LVDGAGDCLRQPALLTLAFTLMGCLPTGNAPSGRHVLSDRTLSGVHFSPSEVEGVLSHLLVTGPAQDLGSDYAHDKVAALYLIPDAAVSGGVGMGQGLSGASLLAEHEPMPWDPTEYAATTDIRGRLLVGDFNKASPGLNSARFDLGTGIQEHLGWISLWPDYPFITLSRGRKRAYLGQRDGMLCELSGAVLGLSNAYDGIFVGEDFYYRDYYYSGDQPLLHLWRFTPYGRPETVGQNVAIDFAFATDQGPRMVLKPTSVTQDATAKSELLFDPRTQLEIPLPPSVGIFPVTSPSSPLRIASPDGHWLVSSSGGRLTFFNWLTAEVSETDDITSEYTTHWEWRPGHDELWFAAADGTLRVWKPNAPLAATLSMPMASLLAPTKAPHLFTSDGSIGFLLPARRAERLATSGLRWQRRRSQWTRVPDHPRRNSSGVSLGACGRQVAGRRLYHQDLRSDYYLIDPDTGISQSFAIHGQVISVGHTRALAIVNWDLARNAGDLRLIDLATQEQTLLAENVYTAAVDPGTHAEVPPGTDALAAGTRIAFLYRHRIDSPYDGLWVTELP
jgi:hypothetical protein